MVVLMDSHQKLFLAQILCHDPHVAVFGKIPLSLHKSCDPKHCVLNSKVVLPYSCKSCFSRAISPTVITRTRSAFRAWRQRSAWARTRRSLMWATRRINSVWKKRRPCGRQERCLVRAGALHTRLRVSASERAKIFK